MQITDANPSNLTLFEQGLRALSADLGDTYRLARNDLEVALFGPFPLCRGLVATKGSALCGVALYTPVMSTMFGGAGVYVSDLWVSAEARGQRLGLQLLREIARKSGAAFVKLAVYEDNPRAASFYTRLGFVPKSGETVMQLSGDALEALVRTE